MKKIIVPTDLSMASISSIRYAIDMAAGLHKEVVLLHVVEIAPYYGGLAQAPYAFDILFESAEERMRQLTKDMVAYASGRTSVSARIREGVVGDRLDEICKEETPFAVVMTSRHGMHNLERFFLGSGVWDAIRLLPCPLIVVPPDAAFNGIRRIGMACDIKDAAEVIPIGKIKEWASLFHAGLEVLNVYDEEADIPAEADKAPGIYQLKQALGEPLPAFHYIRGSHVEDSLCLCAEKYDLDMLAIFPREHNGIWHLFHASHTRRLAAHPTMPLLILHK